MNPLKRARCPSLLCEEYFCRYIHITGRCTGMFHVLMEQETGCVTCPHEWEISAVSAVKKEKEI